MTTYALPFEKPIVEMEKKLQELKQFSESQQIDVSREIERMQEKIAALRTEIYGQLTPWQQVQVARHPLRPYPLDYIGRIMTDFMELHGDRLYADDRAIVGGFARLDGRRVVVVASQKGRDTKSNLQCNFGCAYPEGYRKALRLMRLATKFGLPIISLIDTPGAYPGVESEERHIAEAIAVNLREASMLPVPIIAVITGEGGSGGALGIGVADRLMLLQHAYYSVISPEGCAAILWKDRAFADKAAEALKITSAELLKLGILDEVVPEPAGGAHTNHAEIAATLKAHLIRHLDALRDVPPAELVAARYAKLRAMGKYQDPAVCGPQGAT